jgi:hypothetical protein
MYASNWSQIVHVVEKYRHVLIENEGERIEELK